MKNYIIGFLLIIIIGLLFKGCKKQNEIDVLQGKYLFSDSLYLAEKLNVKTFKTKDSLNVMQVNSIAAEKRALVEYAKTLQNELKAAKINVKGVERVTSLTSETKGQISPRIDTFYSHSTDTFLIDTTTKFSYSDKWVNFTGTIKPKFLINYNVIDSLQIVSHWKRDGLFKPLTLKVTAYSKNPNVTITGIKEIQVNEKPKRFYIGVGAGYGWNGANYTPVFALTCGFKLFQF